jgi:hypothetical protein
MEPTARQNLGPPTKVQSDIRRASTRSHIRLQNRVILCCCEMSIRWSMNIREKSVSPRERAGHCNNASIQDAPGELYNMLPPWTDDVVRRDMSPQTALWTPYGSDPAVASLQKRNLVRTAIVGAKSVESVRIGQWWKPALTYPGRYMDKDFSGMEAKTTIHCGVDH